MVKKVAESSLKPLVRIRAEIRAEIRAGIRAEIRAKIRAVKINR